MAKRFNILKGRFEEAQTNLVDSEPKQTMPYIMLDKGEPDKQKAEYYFDVDAFAVYKNIDGKWGLYSKVAMPEMPDVRKEAMPVISEEIAKAISKLPKPPVVDISKKDVQSAIGEINKRINSLDYATKEYVKKSLDSIAVSTPKPEVIEIKPDNIDMRVDGGYVQWKRGDGNWQDLFAVPKPSRGGGSGAAIKKLQQHEEAADPHPQYLTEAEGDAKYALIGAGGAVDSVNGQTGVVVLDTGDIAEVTDKNYVTDAELALIGTALQSGDNISELINDAGYLTAETDTLQDVTDRGATTTNTVTLSPSGNDDALIANGSGSGVAIDITHTGSGVKLRIDDGGSGDLIDAGSGKFKVTDAGVASLSGLTASTILSADASKNITSLSTSTYPSLTELSYVKGVTSAIQTQLNSKLSGNQTITLSGDVTGSGATAITTTLANSGVTPATYGSSTQVPVITFDAKGRATSVSNQSIAFPTTPNNMMTDGATFVVGELYEAASTAGTTARRATLTKNYIYRGDGAATSRPEKVDFADAYGSMMPRISTGWYVPRHLDDSVPAENQSFLIGFTYVIPTSFEEFFDNLTLAQRVDTAAALGDEMRFILMEDAGNKPGAVISLSDPKALDTTGVKTHAMTSLGRKPGKYWFGAKYKNTVTGMTGSTNILATDGSFSGAAAYGQLHTVYFVIETYATNPSDYSSSTLLQATSGVSNPWIQYTGLS